MSLLSYRIARMPFCESMSLELQVYGQLGALPMASMRSSLL